MAGRDWLASGAAAAVAVTVFALVPASRVPARLAYLVGGDAVAPIHLRGGTRLALVRPEGATAEQRHALASALVRRGRAIGAAIDVRNLRDRTEVNVVGDRPVSELVNTLGREHTFSMRRVNNDTPWSRKLYAAVNGDPAAGTAGVEAKTDYWRLDSTGEQFNDYYLSASNRGLLSSYVTELLRRHPDLAPPPDHEIGIECAARTGECRTYYLERKRWLTDSDVEAARVQWNQYTYRPEVRLSFTRHGGQIFADLTAASVGHKISIDIDGQVTSAPIVQTAIRGGESSIAMGGSDPQQQQRDAEELAASLSSPPLPFPVRVAQTIRLEPRPNSPRALAARGVFALLCGLLALLFLRLARRAGADDDPDGVPAATMRGSGRLARLPWGRLAVSAGALVAVPLLNRLALPFLDKDALATLTGGWSTATEPVLGLFSLGLMPFLSATVLVELACLIVPGWRRLRHGGPDGRARMARPVALVTILLGVGQGWMVAMWLASIGRGPMYAAAVLADPSTRTMLVLAVTMSCGVLLLVALAGVIDRYGLGNGVSVLLLTGLVGEARGMAHRTRELSPSPALLLYAAIGLVVIAVLTRWLMRRRAWSDERPALPMPAAGAVPLSAVFWLLSLAALLAPFIQLPPWLFALQPSTRHQLGLQLILIAVTGGVFAWLFSRPAVWLAPARALGHDIAQADAWLGFARAAGLSVAWLLAVALLYYALRREAAPFLLGLPILLLTVAILADLYAEWRARTRTPDLVPVWPLHRVPLAPMVAASLRERGIEHHLRGLRHRSLLHFFGPYVPIVVMVPSTRAAEATAFLQATLSGQAPDAEPG